jgi:hypothetical protein
MKDKQIDDLVERLNLITLSSHKPICADAAHVIAELREQVHALKAEAPRSSSINVLRDGQAACCCSKTEGEICAACDPASHTNELIGLLDELRPNYGEPGTRDIDVTEKRKRIDRAISILTRTGAIPGQSPEKACSCSSVDGAVCAICHPSGIPAIAFGIPFEDAHNRLSLTDDEILRIAGKFGGRPGGNTMNEVLGAEKRLLLFVRAVLDAVH